MFCNRGLSPHRSRLWKCAQAFYSRRSDPKNQDSFKLVKPRKNIDASEVSNAGLGPNSNWELLMPNGYRFYLPGSVGPAWHDNATTSKIEQSGQDAAKVQKISYATVECEIHPCPLVLRRGVLELFQTSNLGSSELTVVTLSQKSPNDLLEEVNDEDAEREILTKLFVLAAEEMCTKLRLAGFWADFINPFSGRPFLNPFHTSGLYETDERFRCLDFQIIKKGDCKIVHSAETEPSTVIGSLFTTAPANLNLIEEILEQCE